MTKSYTATCKTCGKLGTYFFYSDATAKAKAHVYEHRLPRLSVHSPVVPDLRHEVQVAETSQVDPASK